MPGVRNLHHHGMRHVVMHGHRNAGRRDGIVRPHYNQNRDGQRGEEFGFILRPAMASCADLIAAGLWRSMIARARRFTSGPANLESCLASMVSQQPPLLPRRVLQYPPRLLTVSPWIPRCRGRHGCRSAWTCLDALRPLPRQRQGDVPPHRKTPQHQRCIDPNSASNCCLTALANVRLWQAQLARRRNHQTREHPAYTHYAPRLQC